MKKPLNHHAKKIFYTVFAITFSTALLHHTLLSFKLSMFFLVFALLNYAFLLGIFKRKAQQRIDLQQAIKNIKQAPLATYSFKMLAVNPYFFIYITLVPFLWLGWHATFSTFLSLFSGAHIYDFSMVTWLGLVLFGLFIFICLRAARHSHENDAPFVPEYQVIVSPTHIRIVNVHEQENIVWQNINNIFKYHTNHFGSNHAVCIVYKKDNVLYEKKLWIPHFRMGAQHHLLEKFFIAYWEKATGKTLPEISSP